MAGGPLFPHSVYPVTAGNVFPYVYVSAGANSKHEEGLGVAASIGADSIWRLRFQMPPTTLPSGTAKLRLRVMANATSGSAKVNPQWAMVAAGADPGAATLNAEGVQTVTWAAAGNDKYQVIDVPLVASTVTADNILVMDLLFTATSWTLAQISCWQVCIVWV